VLISVLFSACGGTTGSTSGSGGKGTIIIGGKQDIEAQVLSKVYSLLLSHAGYHVVEKLALGDSPVVFNAIKSGAIDLYPEFTVTGLNVLGLKSSHNPQQDYQTVKAGFEKQFQITWLNPAPLNDTYALCTSKAEAQKLGVTTISDLAPKVSQLTLASPSDGISYVDDLKPIYGFGTQSFKSLTKVDYTIGFQAVKNGQAQVNVCYTTDGGVQQQNFVFLTDTKNGFPAFNPAPIIRDSVLKANPGVPDALNPVEQYITTDASIAWRGQVSAKQNSGMSATQAVKEVATDFLKSKGLL
jgi:osmoprotectant transport system substrate-binding protein